MQKTTIVAIIVLALAIGGIVVMMGKSSTYEPFRVALENQEKEYHIVGKYNKNIPIEYNPTINPDVFSFVMIDNEGIEKKVILNKTKPQDFEKAEQVVVIGKMKNDVFYASDILMKCPSKYNNQEAPTQ